MNKNVGRKLLNSVAGFTLIELVIVMAMIGIISSASFKLIRFSDTNRSLSIAAAELKGAIRTAQTLALAPPTIDDGSGTGKLRTICGFGIRNGDSDNKVEIVYSYSIAGEVKDCRRIDSFATACDGSNTCLPYETKFFDGFTISQPASSGGIFFRSPYGKVFGAGDITITQDGGTHTKIIKVNEYGKINAQ
jgi:prepilin-type N-terminal cleavage/methylation domain-containing protein